MIVEWTFVFLTTPYVEQYYVVGPFEDKASCEIAATAMFDDMLRHFRRSGQRHAFYIDICEPRPAKRRRRGDRGP